MGTPGRCQRDDHDVRRLADGSLHRDRLKRSPVSLILDMALCLLRRTGETWVCSTPNLAALRVVGTSLWAGQGYADDWHAPSSCRDSLCAAPCGHRGTNNFDSMKTVDAGVAGLAAQGKTDGARVSPVLQASFALVIKSRRAIVVDPVEPRPVCRIGRSSSASGVRPVCRIGLARSLETAPSASRRFCTEYCM